MKKLFFILLVIFSFHANASDILSRSFTILQDGGQENVTISKWLGKQVLVLFWRSDCAPCLKEMAILPDIAKQNEDLTILLISLHDVEHTVSHLPKLPSNVQKLVAKDDGRILLKNFGNERTLALPYSVMLSKQGAICEKQYGILSPIKIKEWRKQC